MATLLQVVIAAWTLGDPAAGQPDPFRTACMVPADVRVYLHVDGVADVRAQLLGRPLARWADTLLASGQLGDAWGRLAEAVDVDEAHLFDVCFGRSATLILRGREESAEWAVLTEVDPGEISNLLGRLSPRVLGPSRRLSILHLRTHELLVARRGRQLLIGPWPASRLFNELVPNLIMAPEESLASCEALADARELGPGCAGLFVRHSPLKGRAGEAGGVGGWSVVVADLKGNRMTIRHAARFENAPFARPVIRHQWEMTPIQRFEETTILAFIEPMQHGGGPIDAFARAGLGKAAMTPQMRANLGPRQITTFSDLDGRLQDPPFDLRLPTVARIYEVRDPHNAWGQLDQHMLGLIQRIDGLRGDGEPLDLPDPWSFEPDKPRRVEIGTLARWLFGDIPGVDRVTLNWTIQSGPQGHWAIIATSPGHLNAMAAALASEPVGEPRLGQWASCGTFNGRQLAEHLRSWRDQSGLLVDPPDLGALREGLQMIWMLTEGIERGRWRLWRPSDNRMRLDAELTLSPRDSAR